jgi:hypothetical protein
MIINPNETTDKDTVITFSLNGLLYKRYAQYTRKTYLKANNLYAQFWKPSIEQKISQIIANAIKKTPLYFNFPASIISNGETMHICK